MSPVKRCMESLVELQPLSAARSLTLQPENRASAFASKVFIDCLPVTSYCTQCSTLFMEVGSACRKLD